MTVWEHAMVWALDKMGSPEDGSPGEDTATRAAGIGTIVPPGKRRSYALPLNAPIVPDTRAWFGEGGIRPDAPVVRASRSTSKNVFCDVSGFSPPRVYDAGATDLSFE
jgi:hypothetical protein